MRIDDQEFASRNKAAEREPIFVIGLSFDSANTDIHYLTSEPVTGQTGNIINNTLKIVSSTSQKLNPDKANSTIGSIKFECLDFGLTELQRTKLSEGKGLKGKRVQVFQGYKGLDWTNYQLIQTQIIDREVAFKDGVYKFSCSDIQRAMRRTILEPKTTVLTGSITEDQNTIPALDTRGFETVYQVPSAGNKTLFRKLQADPDYPGLAGLDHMGLIKIENDSDLGYELALYTAKTANSFSNVIRGVLGTQALPVTLSGDEDSKNAPKITEYVYLEMPALKAAYALMTGSLYGHAGEFLPGHWHLGISTDYIATSKFTTLRPDLWDLSDDDKGYPVVIRRAKGVDGKQFIETKLFYMLGVYAPITSGGELSLKSMGSIAPEMGGVRTLNETNIASYGDLKHDQSKLINQFVLQWGYDERREIFTRTSIFTDNQSIATHGETEPQVIKLETLDVTRHTDGMIRQHFDSQRTRYAGPPLLLSLTLTPDQNDLEVGDIVRVNLANIEDYSNESGPLDRAFEIQSITNDWINGRVRVSLFGSSSVAEEQAGGEEDSEALDLSFISSVGTEINAANFPGAGISSSGGVTTISGTLGLSGHADLNNANCIYYCTEDLTIAGTGNINIDLNTQIRVAGFFQCDGDISGKGSGLSGGVPDSTHQSPMSVTAQGKPGKIGITRSQGGLLSFSDSRGTMVFHGLPPEGITIQGEHSSLEEMLPLLELEGTAVNGLPTSLMGTSGSAGCGCTTGGFSSTTYVSLGGAGGAGGAGLVIFAVGGAIGSGGTIDLSGDDGQAGEDFPSIGKAGGGAGGYPGGLLFVNLDRTQAFPSFTSERVFLNHGLCPMTGTLHGPGMSIFYRPLGDLSNGINGGGSANPRQNTVSQNAKIVNLDLKSAPVDNLPDYVETDPTFTLTEQTNTPVTPDGNRSTIEVSVTPPSDSNYAYSIVEYRKPASTRWANHIAPASNEALIEVDSDGSTYEVRIRAVSISGNTSPSGPIETITVTDKNGRTDAELSVIYPFDAITGLGLDQPGTTFTGIDAVFHWDHDNGEYVYFNYYEVQIYSGATLLRTEKSVSPFYEYSYDKNASDYRRLTASTGAYFDLEIRVKVVSKYFNDQSSLYSGSQVTFSASATTTSDPANLRFYTDPASLEQSIQDAGDTANWSNVNDDDGNKPADNADVTDYDDDRINNNNATPYTLAASANMFVNGSSIEKNSGTSLAWDAEVRSIESFNGGAFVSFKTPQANRRLMIGLNSDPETNSSYTGIDYAFYLRNDATYEARLNGSAVASLGAYAADDVFLLVYDGVKVRYFRNGTLVHSEDVAAGLILHLDSSFFDPTGKVESMQFGPLSSSDWGSIGGANRPADNADVTGDNTSSDTNNVGGIDAPTIRSAAALVYRNSAEDGEFVDWSAGTQTTAVQDIDSHSGAYSVLVTDTGITSSSNSLDEIVLIAVPEAIVMSFAGKMIRLSAFVKQPGVADTQFASISFVTPEDAVDGFGVFGNDIYLPNYTSWGRATKDYAIADVPVGGNYYIGIHPDRSRSGKSILVDSLLIEPVADSSDIDHRETQKAPILLRVNSDASIVSNYTQNITATKQSTGIYRIYYSSGYTSYPIIITPHNANVVAQTISFSAGYFRIYFYDDTGAAVDANFSIMMDYRYDL